MNRFCSLIAPIAALFVLAIALPVSGGEQVPFKGHAGGTITAFEVIGSDLHLSISATGEATHLGRFTREETVIIHENGTIEASIIFTAANGDRLFVAVTGEFIGEGIAAGTYTITGGTGRFTNASGEANWLGVQEGLSIAVLFEGMIGY